MILREQKFCNVGFGACNLFHSGVKMALWFFCPLRLGRKRVRKFLFQRWVSVLEFNFLPGFLVFKYFALQKRHLGGQLKLPENSIIPNPFCRNLQVKGSVAHGNSPFHSQLIAGILINFISWVGSKGGVCFLCWPWPRTFYQTGELFQPRGCIFKLSKWARTFFAVADPIQSSPFLTRVVSPMPVASTFFGNYI